MELHCNNSAIFPLERSSADGRTWRLVVEVFAKRTDFRSQNK